MFRNKNWITITLFLYS